MCCFHQENNKMDKTKLRKIIKEELETVMSEAWFNQADAAVDDANRAAEQEYDALTAMISRLDGMESFLLNPARHKSDEPLTQQAADQLNALRATLSQLRKDLYAMLSKKASDMLRGRRPWPKK